MQTLSSALQTELNKGQFDPRILVDLVELYPSDTVPGASGFDPDIAIERFAPEEITWNGNAYRREMVSRGDISRNLGEKTNQCTVTFSNISRYLATLATTTQIEGLFLVIRCVVPSVTDDSIVLFVGRCDKPSDIDKGTFTLSARQDFGNINQEIPPREFTADDPAGRTPSDPLYEGFRIVAISGTLQVPVRVASTSFFGRLFGRSRVEHRTQQWSSLDSTPYGSVVPMIFGRCQMALIPIMFADLGWGHRGVWVIGEGRIDDFTNLQMRDANPDLFIAETGSHYGDPGGTGTNNIATSGPINHGYLSNTAYVFLNIGGSALDIQEDAPIITVLARGMRIPLPNASGVYSGAEWTDNPVHISRFVLTDPRLVNIDPGFMEDSINYRTGLHCDEPLIDDSNGELTLISQADQAQGGTGITRARSTGILDANYYRFNYLGDDSVVPEFENPEYVPFDPSDIPNTFAITRFLRKRYTCNVPLTDKMRAVDFLYKVVFPAAKLFLRINKRGKYEIRSEQPSDATMIRAATIAGATAILVQDATPWKSGDLLQGRIHIGFGLTTSEVRDVISADYSADGNAITLTVSKTGGVTIVASGATLAGGSASVQASGTITLGGTVAPGDTITATIQGIAVTYGLGSGDTTGTAAAMLAAYINGTPKLRGFVVAVWDAASPAIVTIRAKLGVLNVSALWKAHAGPIANPTATPVLADSAGALLAGTYKVACSDVTALGKTALGPVGSITIGASRKIDVAAMALVGASRNWYMSDAADSDYLKYVANTNGSAFSLTALPLPGAALPPQQNTTGEEVIRVAQSFTTNSQDVFSAWEPSTLVVLAEVRLPATLNGHKYQATAGTTGATEPSWPTAAGGTVVDGGVTWTEIGATILGQTGHVRANIKKDTFKYPLGSRQSSVNQVKISYRDSNNDFAKTPYRVNDPAHQALVKKIYPMEVNGEAIDNFHQMFRIANWQLAKNREGDWFYTFGTGPQGLVLEEGDVICASDDSGGLVNQVCRIEELRIHANHDVTIAQARKYSTNMFSDDVGADIIPVPTTLRYVQTVDSLVQFIDNFPIRDADGLVAGFYVAISRDLNTEGDWRGWDLYADYGDGYVKIASGDIPAVMGDCTTTLGTVADPTVFDRTNSVTFTLKYGPPAPAPEPFASVTEQELMSNPRRNLFLVGDEYVQAATIVSNGNQSYTISTLLRGRFGADTLELTHVASERVIFLDGSEQLVSIDPVRINAPFNYKAVTRNQDVADAAPVSFTWRGGTLRPLSPVNLKGYRDSGGNLLIEWTRRSRMSQGLQDISGTPIAEERETYIVEIYNGSTLVRSTQVWVDQGSRVMWEVEEGPPGIATISDDGTVVHSGGTPLPAWLRSRQKVGSDFFLEVTVHTTGTFRMPTMALLKDYLGSGNKYWSISAAPATLLTMDTVHGVAVATGDRIAIEARGGRISYYKNYSGRTSPAEYVSGLSTIEQGVTYNLWMIIENAVGVKTIRLFRYLPETTYTITQQVNDFGSTQSSVKVRVYQVSSVVGRGAYREGVL